MPSLESIAQNRHGHFGFLRLTGMTVIRKGGDADPPLQKMLFF